MPKKLIVLIEGYYQKKKITESEYFFLLTSVIVSGDKGANITSVYGTYLKNFKFIIFQKNSLDIALGILVTYAIIWISLYE